MTPPVASHGATELVVTAVLDVGGFMELWMLTGSALLVGRSSGLVHPGDVTEAKRKGHRNISIKLEEFPFLVKNKK